MFIWVQSMAFPAIELDVFGLDPSTLALAQSTDRDVHIWAIRSLPTENMAAHRVQRLKEEFHLLNYCPGSPWGWQRVGS
jgi:hypothetical protein